MYSRSGQGAVLVVTDAVYKADTGRKGIDGKEIIIDIAYHPMRYAMNFAEAYQLPFAMGSAPIAQVPIGMPGYGPVNIPRDASEYPSTDLYAIGGVYKYKYVSDISPDVEVGDRIYFKPRTLNNAKNYMGALLNEKGKPAKYIYQVPYENIFCRVHFGKIQMIGGWVLLEPIYEDWNDILVPTYFPLNQTLGRKVERPKSQWIQKKVSPDVDNQRGIIAHIGKPLKGETCDLYEGMRVVFRKQEKVFFQHIEGKKYIVISQDMILGELLADIKVK